MNKENTENKNTTETATATKTATLNLESNRKMRELGGDYCFACGKLNPFGLKLAFKVEGDAFVATKELSREFQSYTGIVHGGILSTMLDEAMGGYLIAKGETSVTARLDIRFRQSTPIGVPLTITGREASRRRNFVTMHATVALPDGTVTAEGVAKMAITGKVE